MNIQAMNTFSDYFCWICNHSFIIRVSRSQQVVGLHGWPAQSGARLRGFKLRTYSQRATLCTAPKLLFNNGAPSSRT